MIKSVALLVCSLLVAFTSYSLPGCHAQQMRIETEVMVGETPELVSKSLTLFDDQLIYDFLFTADVETPGRFSLEEIVVFDPVSQSISLLDQQRKLRLTLSHTDLLSMSAAMKASEALRKKDLFLLEPEFEQSIDESKSGVTLSSPRMTYRCKCENVNDPKILLSYYHFADWAARLNVSDARKMPPFARLKLNSVLRKRSWVPTEVQLTFEFPSGQTLRAMASHHRLNQLSENDQIRIQQAQQQMRQFEKTTLIEYRNLNTVSANQ